MFTKPIWRTASILRFRMCFLNFCEKVLGNWFFSRKYLVRWTLERKQILTWRTEHHFRLQGYTGLRPSLTWVCTLYSRRRICSRKEQTKQIHVRQFCSENDPFQFVHACSHVESSHTSLGHGIKKTIEQQTATQKGKESQRSRSILQRSTKKLVLFPV